jgi:hypothetical protein
MAIQNFRAGGFVTDTPSNILFFHAQIDTTGNVSHFRKSFTTVGYQVTAGKTLWISKIIITRTLNATVTSSLKIGYADNDVGQNTATARTNAVMAVGSDITGNDGWAFNDNHRSDSGFWELTDPFPAAIGTKYPFLRLVLGAGASVTGFLIWGFEV